MLRLAKVCVRCILMGLTLVSLLAGRPILGAGINPTIAIEDPFTTGNQTNFTGVLGQNFTVNTAIDVSQLGVFDSGQNGIAGTLAVQIFSSNGSPATPPVTFSPTMEGTLIGADRFQPLLAPVILEPGDYSLATTGFSMLDPNGNQNLQPFTPPTLNSGGGLITFTGDGFLDNGGVLGPVPTTLDATFFNAGSFIYAPEPATALLLAVGLLLLVLAPRLHRQPTQ